MKTQFDTSHLAILKSTPLFGLLTSATLDAILADFRLCEYHKGSTVFHQGDEGQDLYVVVSGLVRVFHMNREGIKTTVNFFTDGEIFGEFAAINGEPRLTTAVAMTNLALLEMPGQRIVYHLHQTSEFALALCNLLVYKARSTSLYAETIPQNNAPKRLFVELLRYTRKYGYEIEPNKRYVLDLDLSLEEFGTLIGKGQMMVNPILVNASNRGLLEFNKGRVTILDLPALINEVGIGDEGWVLP